MTSSTTTHDGQHDPPIPDYDAKSALYNRLADEATTRNKAAVFDALAKAGIVIVTITFDGCSDSGQIEDIQANTQDELVALPSDQIECEHIRWGETEPTRSSCSLRDALEDLACHYLSSTLRIFVRLFQTPAQKIDASAMMRTACSTGAAVRPKGPNGIHRSFQSDQ
jgi:hypothetical protein